MDNKSYEEGQGDSFFQEYSFDNLFSFPRQEMDSSYNQNSSNYFLNKKKKSQIDERNFDMYKTKDTNRNNIVICKEINIIIKGIKRVNIVKIDEGTQTRSPYSHDE